MKDQIEGKAKELKGKVTNDQSTELEGKAQQEMGRAKGKVQGKAEELKGKIRQATS